MEQSLLMLIVPSDMAPILIDWLLQHAAVARFYSETVYTHGREHRNLSLAEQVDGRQCQIQFRVPLPAAAAQNVVADLQNDFAGSGMVYWLQPLQAAGLIGQNRT